MRRQLRNCATFLLKFMQGMLVGYLCNLIVYEGLIELL